MKKVRSHDGTQIAYETTGSGPPLILVGGAFCDHNAPVAGAPIAALLAPRFTAVTFDRRGRGESTNAPPYAIDREVDDIAALIGELGGSASIYGHSSGAVLALEAAIRRLPLDRIALYEPPLVISDARPRPPADFASQLAALAASNRRGDAAELFLISGVGMPPAVVQRMRAAPMWPGLERLADTLSHDATLTAQPESLIARARDVALPALVLDGAASPPWMRSGVKALADALPRAEYRSLDGQTHDVAIAVLAPVLEAFFAGAS
jgi:pimeloyl-ACP methyl ester carboxylesterase